MKMSKFKIPNSLIQKPRKKGDQKLSYTARKVGAVLYAYSNALGTCRKSYAQIARLAGCSEGSAVAAVKTLVAAGYVTFCKTSRWCHAIAGVGKGKNLYSVNLNRLREGYTLVSRDVFRHQMTDAAFVIYLAILSEIGNQQEGWPSISRLQEKTGAARSTVLSGLKLLKRLPTLLVQLCRKRNGACGHNQYKPCRIATVLQKPQQLIRAAIPAFLSPYYRAKRTICKGVKRIFRPIQRLVQRVALRAIGDTRLRGPALPMGWRIRFSLFGCRTKFEDP